MEQNNSVYKFSESRSLWNYSLSPGWSVQEVEILKVALMKFGIGKWKAIEKYKLSSLPLFKIPMPSQQIDWPDVPPDSKVDWPAVSWRVHGTPRRSPPGLPQEQ